MKLIFLYGPPAVGKLTIAEKLSELTGIPLFHNHLSRDLVKDIYGDELDNHYDLVDTIRNDVLEHCAASGTDLIFTYVYGGSEDDENVKSYIQSIESNGGKVMFVELTASTEHLLERVGNDSRKRFKKLADPIILEEMTKIVKFTAIPFVDSFKINTSELDPDASAKRIAQEFNLTTRRKDQ